MSACSSRVWLFVRFLCPWDFTGKNTWVGCHFLLQEVFQTQGSNLNLLYSRRILYHWATWEAPSKKIILIKSIFRIWMSCEGYFYCLFPEKNNQLTLQGSDTQPFKTFGKIKRALLPPNHPKLLKRAAELWSNYTAVIHAK